ncbi:sulfite exporter TauE/SafE family protein [Micromonospora aurantiaca (nom. illeg.)]|uniref:sulfite exporter TauE/SafE family protein n=1 Tax=Micromonospora aurantiaca (nom. illeg.) TaxID=47850 RepID=UPI003DA5423A
MNLVPVLLTGLLAGGVSCAAVQGGLLAGLVARQRATVPAGPASPQVRPRPGSPASAPTRPARVLLADDLAPVGGFLAGKLTSHALLGAVLGALGGAAQLSLHVRTMAQLAAGVLVIAFGLAQLGVPGFKGLVIEPPTAWTRFVRGRARSGSIFAPALLGVASVLIPCGVTLSVMALAITSGSALAGAATMAVFVAGTGPLFAVLGYAAAAARRAAGAWRRRLALATGLVVLAMGLYTFNGGLEMSGSPVAASQLAAAAGFGPAPVTAAAVAADAPPVSMVDGRQVVVITATTGAYAPGNIAVRAGVPTTLVVRAHNAEGCVRAFVIPSMGEQWILPVNGDTSIDLGTPGPARCATRAGWACTPAS